MILPFDGCHWLRKCSVSNSFPGSSLGTNIHQASSRDRTHVDRVRVCSVRVVVLVRDFKAGVLGIGAPQLEAGAWEVDCERLSVMDSRRTTAGRPFIFEPGRFRG